MKTLNVKTLQTGAFLLKNTDVGIAGLDTPEEPVFVKQEELVELQCEALEGNPAPTLTWDRCDKFYFSQQGVLDATRGDQTFNARCHEASHFTWQTKLPGTPFPWLSHKKNTSSIGTFEAHVASTPTSKRAPFPWHWPITKHHSTLALTRRSVKRRCIKSPLSVSSLVFATNAPLFVSAKIWRRTETFRIFCSKLPVPMF